jgi:Protein of unknown function (DUF3408).
MAKKITDEEIDEDFIIASMNTMVQAGTVPPAPKKEESKKETVSPVAEKPIVEAKEDTRKKRPKADYESLFIKEAGITGRKEKTTYLRSKFYRKIQDIILCYDNPGLSVFGYIDAVLSHHFETYEGNIKDILDKRRSEDS